MRSKIEAKLRQMRWSPEQISGWLSAQGIQLSHERIYQMIWDDKRDGGDLWRSLRRCGKRYNKRAGKNAGRGLIPNKIDISKRPAIVARKTRLGDWEGDTVVSAGHKGGLLTLVERKTQLTKIIKLPRATARATQNAAVRRLKPIGNFVHTITFDNGKEFAAHQDIAYALKAKIFFAGFGTGGPARLDARPAGRVASRSIGPRVDHLVRSSRRAAPAVTADGAQVGILANRAALKKRRARAVPHISARLNIDAHREQVSAARVFRRAVPRSLAQLHSLVSLLETEPNGWICMVLLREFAVTGTWDFRSKWSSQFIPARNDRQPR